MGLRFKGNAYSVGDGFCYEGMIINDQREVYHFVIDCGSEAPKHKAQRKGQLSTEFDCSFRLEEITDRIASHGEHIDLFILTHFHADHYNGYKELLAKTRIDKVIMPYLYPEERLCVMINDDMDMYGSDVEFLINPYAAVLNLCRENNPDAKLILVRGSRNNQDDRNQNEPLLTENTGWGVEHEDTANIIETENIDPSHARVVRTLASGTGIPGFDWMFKLFNLEVDESKLSDLRNFVGKMTAQKLDSLINTSKSTLKTKYKVIAQYLYKDLNNTSVVTYHGPIKVQHRCGTLMTGDIDLNHGIADEILSFFQNELNRIALFSIPHHGSNKNWNSQFISHGKLDSTICFAVTHNYYDNRLPGKMMSDLRCHNICVWVVDENHFSEFEQDIRITDGYMVGRVIKEEYGIGVKSCFGLIWRLP